MMNSNSSLNFNNFSLLPLIIPTSFGLFGFYCLIWLNSGLAVDSYFILSTGQFLLETGWYSGLAAISWPPLYVVSTTVFGSFMGLEFSGKLISLLSGILLLAFIPYSLRLLNYSIAPGIMVQLLVATNPRFLEASLWVDHHMLDALLFYIAVIFGIHYFEQGSNSPSCFLTFAILAALTRYSSWILVIAFCFVFLIYRRHRSDTKRILTQVITVFLGTMTPWFIYNYLVNDSFVKDTKIQLLIGQGLAANDLLNQSISEWWAYDVYKFENSVSLILTYPQKYLNLLVINAKELTELMLFSNPLLGLTSSLILLGVLLTPRSLSKSSYSFLITVTSLSVLPVLATFMVWKYFIHVSIILGSLGLAELYSELQNSAIKYETEKLIFPVSIFLVFITSVGNFWINNNLAKYMLTHNFRQPWALSARSEGEIARMAKKKTEPLKIMSIINQFPYLLRAGAQTVHAPPPTSSSKNYLCSSTLSDRQSFFYKKINHPPNQKMSYYHPADYLLIGDYFSKIIKRNAGISLRSLRKYLQPVKHWSGKSTKLYRIKKEELSCSFDELIN